MNLTLTRNEFRDDGIFSTLTDEAGNKVASTLERAYDDITPGKWLPKLYNGTFKCVRGQHRLASMRVPFTTFEITGVEGHTNVLLHIGNFSNDSEGCVLLGEDIAKTAPQMIVRSKFAFEKFMQLQDGITEFQLVVIG